MLKATRTLPLPPTSVASVFKLTPTPTPSAFTLISTPSAAGKSHLKSSWLTVWKKDWMFIHNFLSVFSFLCFCNCIFSQFYFWFPHEWTLRSHMDLDVSYETPRHIWWWTKVINKIVLCCSNSYRCAAVCWSDSGRHHHHRIISSCADILQEEGQWSWRWGDRNTKHFSQNKLFSMIQWI